MQWPLWIDFNLERTLKAHVNFKAQTLIIKENLYSNKVQLRNLLLNIQSGSFVPIKDITSRTAVHFICHVITLSLFYAYLVR